MKPSWSLLKGNCNIDLSTGFIGRWGRKARDLHLVFTIAVYVMVGSEVVSPKSC